MRFRFLGSMLLLILVVGSTSSVAATRGDERQCLVYHVEATVEIGGVPTQQVGVLVVYPIPVNQATGTTTQPNAWEFWLQIGRPVSSPTAGAIFFTSNSYFVPASTAAQLSQLQLATIVAQPNGTYLISPLNLASASIFNTFVLSGGVLAQSYSISGGSMTLTVSGDTSQISGTVNLLGNSMLFPGFAPSVPYAASFEAEFQDATTECWSPGR